MKEDGLRFPCRFQLVSCVIVLCSCGSYRTCSLVVLAVQRNPINLSSLLSGGEWSSSHRLIVLAVETSTPILTPPLRKLLLSPSSLPEQKLPFSQMPFSSYIRSSPISRALHRLSNELHLRHQDHILQSHEVLVDCMPTSLHHQSAMTSSSSHTPPFWCRNITQQRKPKHGPDLTQIFPTVPLPVHTTAKAEYGEQQPQVPRLPPH